MPAVDSPFRSSGAGASPLSLRIRFSPGEDPVPANVVFVLKQTVEGDADEAKWHSRSDGADFWVPVTASAADAPPVPAKKEEAPAAAQTAAVGAAAAGEADDADG